MTSNLTKPLALVLLAATCAPARQPASTGPAVVTITATDYAFAAPDTITAGLTTFRLMNHGAEAHQAVIAGAPDRSFAEIETAMMKEGPIAEWLQFLAGPGVIASHDSSLVTSDVPPGNYLIACFIPSPDGKLHVAKGMFRRLVVVGARPGTKPPPEPVADVTVRLSEYDFVLSAPLTAGTHTLRVENVGAQLHELTIEHLLPAKTLADWQRWAAAGMRGAPVSEPAGGMAGPDKGKVAWITLTLAPGEYLLNCYVPDVKDGRPHFMYGMAKQVRVGR